MSNLNKVQYYGLGFFWKGSSPESQLERFLENEIWENGFDDKYIERVNSVPEGSRVAAKTTYTQKEGGRTISILEIYATGTVIENLQNGKTLRIQWDKHFEPFKIKNKGAYRSTISRINNIETVKEIFKYDARLLDEGSITFYQNEEFKKGYHLFPCFVLSKSSWDDYGYQTTYDLTFCPEGGSKIYIGDVKFLNKEDDNGELPKVFTNLNDHICSLGQSNGFYKRLSQLDKCVSQMYLEVSNDITYNRGLLGEFEHEDGFKTSLLRSSEAQKALREGERIYKGRKIDNNFRFTFSTQIGKAAKKHKIKFDFSDESDLPFRVKVLIGKNGTGKTQFISKLASTISGYSNNGTFSTKYVPPFSRVIAVAYSLFDRFPRPKETRTYSYYYCGFQSGKGFLTENQIHSRTNKALNILVKSKRVRLYGKYLSMVLSEDIIDEILDEDCFELKSKTFSLYDEAGNSKYSSGQIIMILMLAEVLAYITEESILFFDEPETHLHPNGISRFMNVINLVLKKFNSYAIISTHSPQIVQEVPSKDVVVIDRYEDVPVIRGLSIETFGENLSTITERIFHTIDHDEFYRVYLRRLQKRMSYEQILKHFEENSLPLSFNAKIFLQSLYTDEKS